MNDIYPNMYFNNSASAVTSQPIGAYQNSISVNQPRIKREWTYDLCDCCEDLSECCCAFFCTYCYLCQLYIRNGETCCSCLWGGIVPLRTKIRVERAIEGSICHDFCVSYWCTCCSLVQMGQELKSSPPQI